MFEEELARFAAAKKIQCSPKNGNRTDSVVLGYFWGELDLAGEVPKIVLLRRQKNIVKPQVFHLDNVSLNVRGVVMSHV